MHVSPRRQIKESGMCATGVLVRHTAGLYASLNASYPCLDMNRDPPLPTLQPTRYSPAHAQNMLYFSSMPTTTLQRRGPGNIYWQKLKVKKFCKRSWDDRRNC